MVTTTQMNISRPWHALTWLVWAISATTAIQLAPSPVYVVVVIAIAGLVVSAHGLDGPYARAFPLLTGVAVVFALFRVVLTALTTHGNTDELFTTPSFTVPDALGGFTVGGPISAPVVLQAAIEGLVIVGIIAVFGAFNAVVSHYELVHTMPRAFYEVGLIVVVSLAFVPSTIAAVHDVREADRARTGGRVVRRGRLIRQLVPVLECGLERAVTLAESLDSRGFAHAGASTREQGAGWCGAISLLALAGAFVALIGSAGTVAIVLAGVGVVGLALALRLATAGAARVRYRPRRLARSDWIVGAIALLSPITLAVCSLMGDDSLTLTVSPLHWPALHVLPLLALAPLLAPLARQPQPEPVPVSGEKHFPEGHLLAGQEVGAQ